jgi:hypothetical protein
MLNIAGLLFFLHIGTEHSRFIRGYAAYLGDKVATYKAIGYSGILEHCMSCLDVDVVANFR